MSCDDVKITEACCTLSIQHHIIVQTIQPTDNICNGHTCQQLKQQGTKTSYISIISQNAKYHFKPNQGQIKQPQNMHSASCENSKWSGGGVAGWQEGWGWGI